MVETSVAEALPLSEMPVYREGATDAESFENLQNDSASFLVRGYRKAGPVYRTPFRSGEWVVIGGVEANDFSWRNAGKLWSYGTSNAAFLTEIGPDHITALDGETHRTTRAELKPAFDQEPSARYLPQFNELAEAELRGALAKGRIEFNTFWAEEIVRYNTQTAVTYPFPDEVIRAMAFYEYMLLQGAFLEESRDSFVGAGQYQATRTLVMDWIGRMVDERVAAPGSVRDHFERVIAAGMANSEGKPDRRKLITHAYLILAAGVHNTANLATWAVRLAYQHPEWLRLLREEVDAWDGRDVMMLAGMPRLKATVMETLRLRPGFPWTGQHAKVPFTFGGYAIPAGTQVLHAINLCQFLDEYYTDPQAFNPQRFVDLRRFDPKTFGVFGGGVHICVGRNLSLMQAPILLARVLKDYDLEISAESSLGTRVDYSGMRIDTELWAHLLPRR